MASSSQERGNSSQTESPALTNPTSEKNTNPPPPQTYPSPQPMYYPNPHAYPQYPHGYHPQNYQYPQTTPPYYGPPPTYHQTASAGTRFVRGFLMCFVMIITFFLLSSLIVAVMLRPELPIYKIVSLNVNNFTTTPQLGGQWETKVAIENPNDKLVAYFSDLRVDVVFKDGLMSINHAPAFVLNTNDHMDVNVAGLFSQGNLNLMQKNVMDDLVKERETGSITFTLRVSTINMFKSSSLSTKNEEMMAICEGLKVMFPNNNATSGTLDNTGKPVECLLYM